MEKDYSLKKQKIKTEVVEPDFSILAGKNIKTIDDKEPKCSVTINQFASFVDETDSAKRRIVNGQKNPPKESFFWYQSAKAAIKKSINQQEIKPIYDSIAFLKARKVEGKQKERNRVLSIEALETFLKMNFPLKFKNLKKEFIKPNVKHFNFYGIKIRVTPDIVFKGTTIKGETVIGAMKFNISGKPFSKLRMKVVSTLIKKYLEKNIAQEGEMVDGELCFCIDVFGKSIMHAPLDASAPNIEIKKATKEYINIWGQID